MHLVTRLAMGGAVYPLLFCDCIICKGIISIISTLNNTATFYKVFHFFVLFFIRAIFKLYICIPTNCTEIIYFINNTLKHMYCLIF